MTKTSSVSEACHLITALSWKEPTRCVVEKGGIRKGRTFSRSPQRGHLYLLFSRTFHIWVAAWAAAPRHSNQLHAMLSQRVSRAEGEKEKGESVC